MKPSKQAPTKTLDHEFYEKVIAFNSFKDPFYFSVVCDHLKPSYFQHKGASLLVGLLKDYFQKNRKLPNATEVRAYLTQESEVNSFREIISEFRMLDSEYNIDELFKNTEQFLKEKAVYEAVASTVKDCASGEVSFDQTLKKFESACNISLIDNYGFDFIEQYDVLIEDLKKNDTRIPTGFVFLDNKLGGGMLENGRAMYVFMGKPNVGKSIVLGNIAMNVLAQDKTVVLITLEMSEMVYARRIASGISNIEIGNIANKSDDLTKFLKDYKEKNSDKKLIIKEFPPKNLTVAGLSAFFEKLEKKGIQPDCIVLDYLNLLQSDSEDGVYFQIKEIAEHLRGMTYKYNCPLVTATQTNRGGYEGSPEMEDTSESSGLPATADVMVGIYQDDGDKEMGIMKFNIIKNRFGEAFGNFAMKLNYRNLRLEEDSQFSDADSDSNAFSQKLKGL